MKKKSIAIFASGSGSNAENIVRYFSGSELASVDLILSNNADAYVLKRADILNVRTYLFNREQFYQTGQVLKLLKDNEISLIVLAGFLWLIPAEHIKAYPGKIINIHPALLPKYGGKGMYGMNVHKAILANGDKESGITIHFVNENYDEGNIIFQSRCPVSPEDTPEMLAEKVHQLEYEHYPRVIEGLLKGRGDGGHVYEELRN